MHGQDLLTSDETDIDASCTSLLTPNNVTQDDNLLMDQAMQGERERLASTFGDGSRIQGTRPISNDI